MLSKEMKQQSKTQCCPVKQRLQSMTQKLSTKPAYFKAAQRAGVKEDSLAESEGLF